MDTLRPIAGEKPKTAPKGRKADLWASLIGAIAAGLALIGSVMFFAGFVANDSYFGAVVSAFVFTALLSAFAIAPPFITARLAWRAYHLGGTKKISTWALLLCGPWTVLSALILAYTPLPFWLGLAAFLISVLLTIWAVVGLFIEPKTHTATRKRA